MPRANTHRRPPAPLIPVTSSYLLARTRLSARLGFPYPPKWVQFCSALLPLGYSINLYPAKSTHSKYLYITRPPLPHSLKIRFSDHKPGLRNPPSDLVVGPAHNGYLSTEEALAFVDNYFFPPLD